MNFEKWKLTNERPVYKSFFIGKIKDKETFILGEVISENGWISCPFFESQSKNMYWEKLKQMLDCWYPVNEIK